MGIFSSRVDPSKILRDMLRYLQPLSVYFEFFQGPDSVWTTYDDGEIFRVRPDGGLSHANAFNVYKAHIPPIIDLSEKVFPGHVIPESYLDSSDPRNDPVRMAVLRTDMGARLIGKYLLELARS